MQHGFIFLAGCVPMAALLGALFYERWRDKRRGLRVPVSEKLLRPAGHTLARQLSDLTEDFIDHVVVGPGGVFAIETKVRSKLRGLKGQPDFRAVFDGKVIRFPRCEDYKSPEQALRNARWLAEMLSKAIGEKVTTQAIVALPGWMVDTTAKDGMVKVLNAKQVPGYINWCKPILSEKLSQQIAYQLEQRCRDVEF